MKSECLFEKKFQAGVNRESTTQYETRHEGNGVTMQTGKPN